MKKFTQFGIRTHLPSPAGFILMQSFVMDCKKIGWEYCKEFISFSEKDFERYPGLLFSPIFDLGMDRTLSGTLMSLTSLFSGSTLTFVLETEYSKALNHAKKVYESAMAPYVFYPKKGDYIHMSLFQEEDAPSFTYTFIASGSDTNPTEALQGYSHGTSSIFRSDRVVNEDNIFRITEFRYATEKEKNFLDKELFKAGLVFNPLHKCIEFVVKYEVGKFYTNPSPFGPNVSVFQCVGIEDEMVFVKLVAGIGVNYYKHIHPTFGEVFPFCATPPYPLRPLGEEL